MRAPTLIALALLTATGADAQERRREILNERFGDARITIVCGKGWVQVNAHQGVDHVQMNGIYPDQLIKYIERVRQTLERPVTDLAPGETMEFQRDFEWGETISVHRSARNDGDRFAFFAADEYTVNTVYAPMSRRRLDYLLAALERAATTAIEMKAAS